VKKQDFRLTAGKAEPHYRSFWQSSFCPFKRLRLHVGRATTKARRHHAMQQAGNYNGRSIASQNTPMQEKPART
jgi:hypothetical protein